MARTIEEIKKEITDSFVNDADVRRIYGLRTFEFENEFSKVSLESLLFYTVAFSVWTLEKLFDVFRDEQESALNQLHPHSLYWYVQKAKDFQRGYDLPPFEETYDNADLTQEEISRSKIVAYASCAVYERVSGASYLRLKTAKGNGSTMEKLDLETELPPFRAYMEQIKDAGVVLECDSSDADAMTLTATVLIDPQLFYNTGESVLRPGTFPIADAFKEYLTRLPFDGIYTNTAHMDYVQLVRGVRTVSIDRWNATYGADIPSPRVVDGCRPDSGWIRFKEEGALTIHYKTDINDISLRQRL